MEDMMGDLTDRNKHWRMFLILCWLGAATGFSGEEAPSSPTGVVIEEIREDSVLKRVGIQPGDVFYRWARLPNPPSNPEGASGVFESPFDWMLLEIEQAPRGVVNLFGERDGVEKMFSISFGPWEAQIRPVMNKDARNAYTNSNNLIENGQVGSGLKVGNRAPYINWISYQEAVILEKSKEWRKAIVVYKVASRGLEGYPELVGLIWKKIGSSYMMLNQFGEAHKAFRLALKNLNTKKYPLLVAHLFNYLGELFRTQGDLIKAESYQLKAFHLQKDLAPESLSMASSLNTLGVIARIRGNLEAAEQYFFRALEIREKKAPNSFQLALTLGNLGNVATTRGDLKLGEQYYLRVLDIFRELVPDSPQFSSLLGSIGNLSYMQGDLKKAEYYYLQSLEAQRKAIPNSLNIATTLNNLGALKNELGEVEEAERYYLKSLKIRKKYAPNSLMLASTWANLGGVADDRGEFEKAERFYLRALRIEKEQAPDSLSFANTLNNLGLSYLQKKDLENAEKYFLKALNIRKKLSPNSRFLASSLNNLGATYHRKGDLEKAEQYHLQSLKIRSNLPNTSLDLAFSYNNLGKIAWERGDFKKAEHYHIQALKIRTKLAPNSISVAASYNYLGSLAIKMGNLSKAADDFIQSIQTMENLKFGGSEESEMNFRSMYQKIYKDLIDLDVSLDKNQDAFKILERYRARTLLEMMAERDLDISEDETSTELMTARKRAAFQYEKTQQELAALKPDDPAGEPLRGKLFEIRREYEAVNAQIREKYPKLAPPAPLGLDQVRTTLDPGTVMLSFCVLEEKTVLFMIRRDEPVKTLTIPKNEAFWNDKITEMLGKDFQDPSKIFFPEFLERSHTLYSLLIEPIIEEIESAERLVIIPDGPLRKLPFALLFDQASDQYLIEKKPLSSVVSATVYAELKNRPRKPFNRITAVGDPIYPGEEQDVRPRTISLESNDENRSPLASKRAPADDRIDFVVRSRMNRNGPWPRLPQTAREVNRIADLFAGKAQIWLRGDASEDMVKTIGRDADIIHIAAHAFTDDHRALDSGLVLTINEDFREGEENGILHAWEIIEGLRIEANLVVLSACQTGLGKDAGGEGLIGLTHAFQFAGARSIIASYWNVNDLTTAALMERFYGYLKDGHDKATSLQKAQIDLIRKPIKIKGNSWLSWMLPAKTLDASHPYYWAGFQLIGPWD